MLTVYCFVSFAASVVSGDSNCGLTWILIIIIVQWLLISYYNNVYIYVYVPCCWGPSSLIYYNVLHIYFVFFMYKCSDCYMFGISQVENGLGVWCWRVLIKLCHHRLRCHKLLFAKVTWSSYFYCNRLDLWWLSWPPGYPGKGGRGRGTAVVVGSWLPELPCSQSSEGSQPDVGQAPTPMLTAQPLIESLNHETTLFLADLHRLPCHLKQLSHRLLHSWPNLLPLGKKFHIADLVFGSLVRFHF